MTSWDETGDGLARATDTLERIVKFRPAHDCLRVQPCVKGSDKCKPDQGGSHGIGNVELTFTLRGPDAEVSLVIGTGWYLPVTPAVPPGRRGSPMGYFVEIHTARPRFEGQEPRTDTRRPGDSCEKWAGCYVDTGFLMSDVPTALLVEKGSDALWEWLENQYETTQYEMRVQELNTGREGEL